MNIKEGIDEIIYFWPRFLKEGKMPWLSKKQYEEKQREETS